jgi:predicted RNA binding protein YcfA (HicA-like mRNA interferase family)
VKLPRDLSGRELAKMLEPYGYRVTRQAGSHLRLTCSSRGKEHHITIPAHASLRVGTLSGILSDVSNYLELDRHELARRLFGG